VPSASSFSPETAPRLSKQGSGRCCAIRAAAGAMEPRQPGIQPQPQPLPACPLVEHWEGQLGSPRPVRTSPWESHGHHQAHLAPSTPGKHKTGQPKPKAAKRQRQWPGEPVRWEGLPWEPRQWLQPGPRALPRGSEPSAAASVQAWGGPAGEQLCGEGPGCAGG